MNDARDALDRAPQAQIDRLVAGALPEQERRRLLVWLDEDFRRWRACAVAFLEAQMWEAAGTEMPACGARTLVRSASGGRPAVSATTQHGGRRLYAVSTAACVTLAFAAGAVLGRLSAASVDPALPP